MNRSDVEQKLLRAANKANGQVANPSGYRDYGHNEYFNKLCNNLHAEGISFEREKVIGNRKPDIYIPGFGAVEVKAKTSGLSIDDRTQAEAYARNSNLPCTVINFGTQDGPHVRKFSP